MKKKNLNQYAIYKGDYFMFVGNVYECAEYLNVEPKTIYWYASPSQRKRNKSGKRIEIERCGHE